MATWYTDVALNQQQGVNFPGFPGTQTLTTQPGTQNNPLFEGPFEIVATYVWTGNEVANDVINIAILPAGTLVDPNGRVSSGLTQISTALTMAIGDNDLGSIANLPIPNGAALLSQSQGVQGGGPVQAPLWVSGTNYAAGNVVLDANSTPINMTYTAVAAVSNSVTAPHSAATTIWIPNNQRYSNSVACNSAAGNVAFVNGTQLYGGAASIVPYSTTPNSVPQNLTNSQLLFQQYQIQFDCWAQALLLTCNAATANTVSIFRIPVILGN